MYASTNGIKYYYIPMLIPHYYPLFSLLILILILVCVEDINSMLSDYVCNSGANGQGYSFFQDSLRNPARPSSDQYEHPIKVKLFSVKDVIYQKGKTGKEMVLRDVKKCLLKNLTVINAKETLSDNIVAFEEKWNLFIQDFREDIHTRNS